MTPTRVLIADDNAAAWRRLGEAGPEAMLVFGAVPIKPTPMATIGAELAKLAPP